MPPPDLPPDRADESFRAFDPAEPVEPGADPVEEWLLWEEQANLVGFRTGTGPVRIEVASVPRERVEVHVAAAAPARLVGRFLGGGRVRFPRHPLNRDAAVAFSGEPVAEVWWGRSTSSRTLVVPSLGDAPLFSLKLPTDHPHPRFHQPEKTRLADEIRDAMRWVALLERVERLLGPEPGLAVVREALAVCVPGTETGFLVRDLRRFRDGHHYLPALSIPFVGPGIARRFGEPFERFWQRHYAEAAGRAKALLLARSGLQFETPNPQNLLVQLDAALRPTGCIVVRDLGDADCASDAPDCRDVPWTALHAPLRPETANSFWAFGEAGAHAVATPVLEAWAEAHDRAYFATLAAWFPRAAAGAPPCGEAALAHWSEALRGAPVAEGFAARRAGRGQAHGPLTPPRG